MTKKMLGVHNTSPEIIAAIELLADGDENLAHDIWYDPTEEEILAIWKQVTKNGLMPATDFQWGESGTKWYP